MTFYTIYAKKVNIIIMQSYAVHTISSVSSCYTILKINLKKLRCIKTTYLFVILTNIYYGNSKNLLQFIAYLIQKLVKSIF